MTLAAISGSLIFNFTTNGNGRLLAERLQGIVDDPATLGILLAVVYTIASLAQLVVGKLIDRYPIKRIYLPIVAAQVPLFLLAAYANGWALYAVAVLFMLFVFGAIPFIDAMIVVYVDDRMRSRVSGMRLAVSFGVSALAVYVLGPVVKAAGFTVLLTMMAGISDAERAVRLAPARRGAGGRRGARSGGSRPRVGHRGGRAARQRRRPHQELPARAQAAPRGSPPHPPIPGGRRPAQGWAASSWAPRRSSVASPP